MSVTVMSRKSAIQYCRTPHSNPAIMISISSFSIPYDSSPFSSKENNIKDILSLVFDDVDAANEKNLMTMASAKKIAHFINKYPETDIIVHCDAGISRSAGVAAAIMKFQTGDDSLIFDSGKYRPNMWCYTATLYTLMGTDLI